MGLCHGQLIDLCVLQFLINLALFLNILISTTAQIIHEHFGGLKILNNKKVN